ncbi:RecB-like helicase [Nitrosophilus labii]|uniref:RecB-like helicase n=1 Tax=Nitrosophilus labii TaxID=2706014 RepID=UPI0016570974|nr:RecB-like helicase [Nitrosophilus labii]
MERLLAYEASAGTGKTFALVVRYLSLLFMGAKPDRILALTFTNKAANEMRVRIQDRLKNLKDSHELEFISQNTSLTYEEILKKQPLVYKKFLSSDIKITTIDSFFVSILRKFAMYAGLIPDFIISQDDKSEIIYRFLYFTYLQKKSEKVVILSFMEDKKLKDIFSLFEALYEKFIDESFDFVKRDITSLEIEIMRVFAKIKDFIQSCPEASKTALSAVEAEDIDEILKKGWLEKKSLKDYRYFKKCYKESCDIFFNELKIGLKTYLNAKEAIFLDTLFELYLLYKKTNILIKRETNRLSFSDIQNFTYHILKEKIDNQFLYFRLDSKIEHLLIDEFQDTSLIQYRLLEPIIEEICAGEGQKEGRTFFYVGDIKQSIYRFRGGYKELFNYVARKFDVKIVPMDTNFRSDRAIVDFINEIFEPLYKQYFGYFTKQKANSKNEGYVEVKSSDEVLKECVNSVKMLTQKGISYEDIAILCFKNDEILEIESALKEQIKDIKVVTESSSKLVNQKEIILLIEFMKYLYFEEEIFKANFLAAISKDIDTKIDLELYKPIMNDLALLIQKVLKDFDIGIKNENVLKFIEILRNYKTLGEFLFDLERVDEKVTSSTKDGIKILTVHKSKGLEFKHVILCDRLSRKPSTFSSLIFDMDKIGCKRVYYRKKGREFVDENYKNALEKEKRLSQEDELNAMYVAFTRARNSLIILKKQQRSAFDFLHLSETKRGELSSVRVKKSDIKNVEIDFQERFYGLQNIKTKNDQDYFSEAIIFGNALHYALEMIDFNDLKTLNDAMVCVKNRFGFYLKEEKIADIEKRVRMLLEKSEFTNLLSSKEICKEQPISFNQELKQIDLLLLGKDANIVIDYKSSKEDSYKHKKQVLEYVEAVKKITNNETIGYVCYLLEEKIEMVKV